MTQAPAPTIEPVQIAFTVTNQHTGWSRRVVATSELALSAALVVSFGYGEYEADRAACRAFAARRSGETTVFMDTAVVIQAC